MAEDSFDIISGDSLILQQYLDTFRRSEQFGPEKSLLAAILEDAVQEYRKYSEAKNADGKRRFREVEEWMMMHGEDGWIFSFHNVCELLGLDPEYVRGGLRKTQSESAEEERRIHRNGMRRRAA